MDELDFGGSLGKLMGREKEPVGGLNNYVIKSIELLVNSRIGARVGVSCDKHEAHQVS